MKQKKKQPKPSLRGALVIVVHHHPNLLSDSSPIPTLIRPGSMVVVVLWWLWAAVLWPVWLGDVASTLSVGISVSSLSQ